MTSLVPNSVPNSVMSGEVILASADVSDLPGRIGASLAISGLR